MSQNTIRMSNSNSTVSSPNGSKQFVYRTGQPMKAVFKGAQSGPPRYVHTIKKSQAGQIFQGQRVVVNSDGTPVMMSRRQVNYDNSEGGTVAPVQRVQRSYCIPGLPPMLHFNNRKPDQPDETMNIKTPPNYASQIMNNTGGSIQAKDVHPPPMRRRPIQMRLRSRGHLRGIHESCFEQNDVVERDADVIFFCKDGGRVRGHKLILASESKFFTDMFRDQPIGEISIVSVPDVTSEIMKLITLLAYKGNVIVSGEQLGIIKDYLMMFEVNMENLSADSVETESSLDVLPGGKIEENIHRQSNFFQRYGGGGSPQKRRMVPSFTSAQLQSLSSRKGFPGSIPIAKSEDPNARSTGVNKEEDNEEEGSDGETFRIQGYTDKHGEKRKSKLTPRVESENVQQAEDNDHLIKQWMNKVGKSETEPRVLPDHVCKICHATFFKRATWEWHENRHVALGMYSCIFCKSLHTTSRAIWDHEKEIHGFIGLPLEVLQESHSSPNKSSQGVKPPNRGTSSTMRLAQIKKSRAMGMGAKKSVVSPTKFPRAMPSYPSQYIKIGHHADGELDDKKIKQLHWIYVCARCDNCADSLYKAQNHYKKCYPENETVFESTVVKYRQGFYGKSGCPLCPRRYVANGGWTIHCGHQHHEFRRLFTHTGITEDKIKCVNCRRKYGSPEDFFNHLHKGIECINSPINDETMPLLLQSQAKPTATTSTSETLNTSTFPKKDQKIQKPTPSPSVPTQKPIPALLRTPPRSARLAKRASALLMAQVLSENNDESEEEKLKKQPVPTLPAKRKASVIDYPPVDCPLCGETEIGNFSQHLTQYHEESGVSVTRISTDLLRCKKCYITFAICDLLGHKGTCAGFVSDEVAESSSSDVAMPKTVTPKAKLDPESYKIPPGVGSSPIERMELSLDQLADYEVLYEALTCPVCEKKGSKLGDSAHCLKTHGIIRCSICLNTYVHKDDYQAHIRNCHSVGNNTKCPFCKRQFTNIGQCVGHLFRYHWPVEFNRNKKGNWGKSPITATKPNSTITNEKTRSKEMESEDGDGGDTRKIRNAAKSLEMNSSTTPEEQLSDEEVDGEGENENQLVNMEEDMELEQEQRAQTKRLSTEKEEVGNNPKDVKDGEVIPEPHEDVISEKMADVEIPQSEASIATPNSEATSETDIY